MKVAELMTDEVRACSIHESVNAAARIMWENDCGCAPVVDGHGRLAGMVTDRDICMAAYTQGLPLEAIPVERVMSAKVVSCSRTDNLETAHRLMRSHEIHRMPVLDSRGRLVGILSLSDVVNHRRVDHPADVVELATTYSAIHRRREPEAAALVSSNGDGADERKSTRTPRKKSPRGVKPSADLR